MEDKEKIEELYERIWQLEKEKIELEERNNKTIKYIKNNACYSEEDKKCKCSFSQMALDNLLKILKGENNENKN